MATHEVSTWPQLRNALTIAYNEITTIKLIADIDCNDDIPTGAASTIIFGRSDYALTIDGSYQENGVTKRHEIRNLRTDIASPVPIFQPTGATYAYGGKTTTIKGIDFFNLILDAPLFQGGAGGDDLRNYCVFNNCRFTGKRTTAIFSARTDYRCSWRFTLQGCYVNVPYYGMSQADCSIVQRYPKSGSTTPYCSCYSDYSRIHINYTGTYTPVYDAGNVYSDIYNVNLNDSRIEGDIVGHRGDSTNMLIYTQGVTSERTPSIQNVYDVNFYMMGVSSDSLIELHAYKGVIKIPVKKWEDKTTTYSNYQAQAGLIFATESQMQDITWLIQQNFDVVPSNT